MRASSMLVAVLVTTAFAGAAPAALAQQPGADSAARGAMSVLRTRQGSVLIGHVTGERADSVRFETAGGVLTFARTDISEIKAVSGNAIKNGSYWFPDPNGTRLFFAPTGRMLRQGEGYFSSTELFLQNVVAGATDHVTLGGGVSAFPSDNLTDQVLYFTPKVGLLHAERLDVAAGALIGFAGGIDNGKFGILYGVTTYGSPDASITAGAGWGYGGSRLSTAPLLMLGGSSRVSARAALVTENYLFPHGDGGLASYGVRFFGEKLSVDLAFFNLSGPDMHWVFPGFPYVAFAVKL